MVFGIIKSLWRKRFHKKEAPLAVVGSYRLLPDGYAIKLPLDYIEIVEVHDIPDIPGGFWLEVTSPYDFSLFHKSLSPQVLIQLCSMGIGAKDANYSWKFGPLTSLEQAHFVIDMFLNLLVEYLTNKAVDYYLDDRDDREIEVVEIDYQVLLGKYFLMDYLKGEIPPHSQSRERPKLSKRNGRF